MRSSQLEVLHILGCPVYARTSLLEACAKKTTGSNASKPIKVEDVHARAQAIAQQPNSPRHHQTSVAQSVRWSRFSIGLVASKQALVVFDCPPTDFVEHRSLVENMLRKCGCALKELPFEHFRWPIVENANITQGEDEAARTLTMMQAKLVDAEGTWGVVAGESAQRIFDTSPFAERVIHLETSITKMLDQPELRKQAWDLLSPLREQIKAKEQLPSNSVQ